LQETPAIGAATGFQSGKTGRDLQSGRWLIAS